MGISQDYDLILNQLGNFGKYQIKQFIIICIPTLFVAAFSVSYVFTAAALPHRCLVEVCGDENCRSEYLPPWWQEAIPPNDDGDKPSSCLTYKPLSNETCIFDKTQNQTCNEWVYDGVETSIQTEFSITCKENAWKLTLVGTIDSFGRFLGLPLIGFLSDKYGRKFGLLLTLFFSATFGLIRAFSTSYVFFMIFQFLEALFAGSAYGIIFIYAMEFVSPRRREMGGAITVWSYASGLSLLGVISWALKDWRQILIAVYAPVYIIFLLYIWLLPESIRWLFLQGKATEAEKLINEAAKMNKITLNDDCEKIILKLAKTATLEEENESGEPTLEALKQVFKSKQLLLRLANCSFCWITNALVYYGLSLNSVTLAGTENSYLNFVLVSLVEIPGYCFVWLGMKYIGRRKTLCIALIISGIACSVSPFVQGITWAQLLFYLIGKLAITGAFDTLYVFTSEIFPTRLRTSMLSTCSMIGRIGSMIAPQTALLQLVSPLLPMLLFGVVALIAGILALLFPETRGKTLPDSIDEATALGNVPLTTTEYDNNNN